MEELLVFVGVLGGVIQLFGVSKTYLIREKEIQLLSDSSTSIANMSTFGNNNSEYVTPNEMEDESNEIRRGYNDAIDTANKESVKRYVDSTNYLVCILVGFLVQSSATLLAVMQ